MKRLTIDEAHKRQDAMKAYYAEGHTTAEVAEKFETSRDYAKQICRGIRQGNQYTNGLFDREANAIKWVNKMTPDFEYVGGFTGVDGQADLKCKTCGTITTRRFVSIRQGYVTCAVCEERKREDRIAAQNRERQIAKQLAEQERKEREENKLLNAYSIQINMNVCPVCGSLFVVNQRKKYCSSECCKRANNAIKKDRRIRKLRHIVKDHITLKELYKRDRGTCYICGEACDFNDYTIREDGAFIAFDKYPSVDHVIPLSHGGAHAWGNVRLACRGCNSKKSDTIPSPVQK